MNKTVKTTCPYCGVGCGIEVGPGYVGPEKGAENTPKISGDACHSANYGKLCSKGAALTETLGLEGRLLEPEIHGKQTNWESALDAVANGFTRILREHGPQAVAFYVSGQLLTEDYYLANKLMKGFMGSANIDTNSRLCMASSVAGHKRAFGGDTVPGCYEDLEKADLVVFAGSNAAWCHPVLFARIEAARANNPDLKTVVIDPRRTATCESAHIHLALKPGSDAILFNGLLAYLHREGYTDRLYMDAHTQGGEEALAAAESARNIAETARACGLETSQVAAFFDLFARTGRVVTLYSQGINQSSSGTDKVNAILNCHLATGRMGREGMGPFSLTGQPNAMGGREVGGLATQLAAHMELENPDHRKLVQTFWNAPHMPEAPGLKAVDMFRAPESEKETGEVKAIWIMGTNPAVSLPDSARVRAALSACELVVVSDCERETDTTALAHILLPALAWGEKDGTVTNSERRISRQRAFLPSPGAARPDWWMICEVARRMGHGDAFAYDSTAEIFREHARLSGHENNGERAFNISALATMDDAAYDGLAPIQWPVTAEAPEGTSRLYGDGRFFTAPGKARMVPIDPRPPVHEASAAFPLVFNTGRGRDHWHTMTRTAKSPALSAHCVEPTAHMHPADVEGMEAQDGALVTLESALGSMTARLHVDEGMRKSSVFVPMHWNDRFARQGCVDALIAAEMDPISGQPELKHMPVRVTSFEPAWHGFVLSRRDLAFEEAAYLVVSAGKGFRRMEIAGTTAPEDWSQWARRHLCEEDDGVEWIDFLDPGAGSYRGARITGGRLESCIFVAGKAALPSRDWLAGLFSEETLSQQDRTSLLAGKPSDPRADTGPTVCACFGVGLNTLARAITQEGCVTVEEIGAALKAGTSCGSCIPEIRSLIASLERKKPRGRTHGVFHQLNQMPSQGGHL